MNSEQHILNSIEDLRLAREICHAKGLPPSDAEYVAMIVSRARMSSAIVAAIDRLTTTVEHVAENLRRE